MLNDEIRMPKNIPIQPKWISLLVQYLAQREKEQMLVLSADDRRRVDEHLYRTLESPSAFRSVSFDCATIVSLRPTMPWLSSFIRHDMIGAERSYADAVENSITILPQSGQPL